MTHRHTRRRTDEVSERMCALLCSEPYLMDTFATSPHPYRWVQCNVLCPSLHPFTRSVLSTGPLCWCYCPFSSSLSSHQVRLCVCPINYWNVQSSPLSIYLSIYTCLQFLSMHLCVFCLLFFLLQCRGLLYLYATARAAHSAHSNWSITMIAVQFGKLNASALCVCAFENISVLLRLFGFVHFPLCNRVCVCVFFVVTVRTGYCSVHYHSFDALLMCCASAGFAHICCCRSLTEGQTLL